MQRNIIRISIGVIIALLSLSTTAYAGYKTFKKNDAKVLGVTSVQIPTATPQIIEQIEEVVEIEDSETLATNTPQPTFKSVSTQSPIVTNKPFFDDDDDDDEVEFEDSEDENEDNIKGDKEDKSRKDEDR